MTPRGLAPGSVAGGINLGCSNAGFAIRLRIGIYSVPLMTLPPDRPRSSDVALLLFGVGLLIFISPARVLWANPERHWLTPFALWLFLIVVATGFAFLSATPDPLPRPALPP